MDCWLSGTSTSTPPQVLPPPATTCPPRSQTAPRAAPAARSGGPPYASRIVGRNLTRSEWSQNILDEEYRETVPGLPVPEDEEMRWRGRLYN